MKNQSEPTPQPPPKRGSKKNNEQQTTVLQVNGESFACKEKSSLPELLEQMELDPRLVAVEYNGEILHRQYWQTTEMKEGDRLEIVTIVGGG
ncbi:MAG: sulfur carrier protein ThiS [Cyanobacteria bacterium P01_E01_bin.42]